MRYGVGVLGVMLVGLGACADGPRITEPGAGESNPSLSAAKSGGLQDRYIVVFRGSVADPDGATDDLMRSHEGQVHYRYRAALKGFAASLPAPALEGIRRNPNVDYVEADGIMSIAATQSPATWGLDRIDQRNLPLSSSYTYNASGSGVRSYIIDTGIRSSHNEFGGRASGGFTAISDGRGTDDCNGHGTHVAGTVGGTTYGVAKSVSLVPVRVLNCQGSGTTSGVIAGVDWVTANHIKPAVANMSLGGGASSSLDNAVANSISAGVTYAVAAGNSNANACNYSPARVGTAITVGATTSSDARASYSNFGSCLDLFAPGSSITSAWSTSNTATNTISGTSMASPHVAGVAALVLQAGHQSPSNVRNAIVNNATSGVVSSAGSGSPNLLLYSGFVGGGSTPNNPPTASFTSSCSNLACNFNGSGSSDSDGTITGYQWTFGDGTSGSGSSVSKTYGAADTYSVTLTVTDDDLATGSQTRSVTVTASSGGGTVIYLQSLSGASAWVNPSRRQWRATVTALVHNNSGQPVSGATVTGSWSNGTTGSTSCTTGSAGTCSVQTGNVSSGTSSVRWNVGTLSATGATYDPALNNASGITVARP
ncbi:MAG TPA: S8 family serine peptidase [Gemmatimonadaceae bacterium]|nr:S8 family serine peptidase [Gemmatimonadaceae bacterium]